MREEMEADRRYAACGNSEVQERMRRVGVKQGRLEGNDGVVSAHGG